MSLETDARDEIVRFAVSIYERSLTFGASGNISVRIKDGWLMTPTGSTMGNLDPARLSKLDNDGNHISGDEPTREHFLHMAMYHERPNSSAIVHLHSTYSVAVRWCGDVDPTSVLPPITAYFAMKVGTLPLVPYFPPGSLDLADAVRGTGSKPSCAPFGQPRAPGGQKFSRRCRLRHRGTGADRAPVSTPAPGGNPLPYP